MRVIAGEKRGMQLYSPVDSAARPTLDRVKEAVFGALQFELYGKTVLDLFAGSGALGIEALSRGAAAAVFADSDKNAIEVTQKNISKAGYGDRSEVLKENYAGTINLFKNTNKFDIVFMDPPYKSGFYASAMKQLYDMEVLNKGALIVTESEDETVPDVEGFTIRKRKKYGKTVITIFEKKEQ